MRTTRMAFALACFVLAGLPVSADTLGVCRGRAGRIQLRDACRRGEVNLGAIETGGAPGPQGAAGPPGPPGPPGECQCAPTTSTTLPLCGGKPCACDCLVEFANDGIVRSCANGSGGPAPGPECRSSGDCPEGYACIAFAGPESAGLCAARCQ